MQQANLVRSFVFVYHPLSYISNKQVGKQSWIGFISKCAVTHLQAQFAALGADPFAVCFIGINTSKAHQFRGLGLSELLSVELSL